MKFKNIILIILTTFFFSINTVYANTSFSSGLSSSSEVILNQEFAVNVVMSNLSSTGISAGQYYLNYDSSKLKYIGYSVGQGKPNSDYNVDNTGSKIIMLYIDNSGGENPLKNGNFITLKFKAISTGNVTFALSGDGFSTIADRVIDLSTNSSSKSILIKEQETTKVTTTTNATTKKIETTTKITEEKTTTTKKVDQTEDIQESEKMTSKRNASTTSKIEDKNNNYLKSLTIDGIDFVFDKNQLNYEITVPFEIEKLDFIYELENNESVVNISNNNLKVGINEIIIKLTANDKSETVYKIKVNRYPKYTTIDFNKITLLELLNSNTQYIEININYDNSNKIIEKEFLNLIKEKNSEIKFNIISNDTILYYFIINKDNIEYINDYLNLNIIDDKKIENIKNINYKIINYQDNKTLNKNIALYLNTNYFKTNKIYLYELEEDVEEQLEFDKTGYYIKLNLEKTKNYLISDNEINLNNGNNLLVVLTITLLVLVSMVITFFFMKKKKMWWFK